MRVCTIQTGDCGTRSLCSLQTSSLRGYGTVQPLIGFALCSALNTTQLQHQCDALITNNKLCRARGDAVHGSQGSGHLVKA